MLLLSSLSSLSSLSLSFSFSFWQKKSECEAGTETDERGSSLTTEEKDGGEQGRGAEGQ